MREAAVAERSVTSITGRTRVVGIFGDPVEHSLSPPMHNRAFSELGLDWVYVPFHVVPERLPAAVEAIRALSLAGVNVTVPHKVSVVPYLDRLSDEARLIGAVNTIVNHDGELEGQNTDGVGFVRSLRREADFDPRGRSILIVGAGGAAQAIAVRLAVEGAGELLIANRTPEKAEALADLVRRAGGAARAIPLSALARADVGACEALVHTTSWGMAPHDDVPPVVDPSLFHRDLLVCDIVYTPRQTSLLAAAAERGCRTLPGLGMLVEQAAVAFELWTGEAAPVAVMRKALEDALARRSKEGRAGET